MGANFPGGVNSLAYQGNRAPNPANTIVAQRAPTVNDLNHDIGTNWINEVGQDSYVLVAISGGQAVWNATGSGETGISTIHTDSGDVSPSGNAITIAGGTNLNTSGSGSTVTVNLDATISGITSITGTTALFTTFDTNVAAAGSTLSGVTWAADGTDANISLIMAAKGTGGVFHSRSAAGVTVDSGSINSDNTDPASTSMVSSSVGGTSAGDAQFQALISGGQVYTFGIDNSTANDNFVISKNAALGTANILSFDGTSDAATFGASVAATTTLTATLGDITATNGNVVAGTAGNGIKIAEGANARMGQATLTAGVATVANTSVTANTRIFVSRTDKSTSTALGVLEGGTITPSTSFVINALNPTDATVQTNDVSVVNWQLVEPA